MATKRKTKRKRRRVSGAKKTWRFIRKHRRRRRRMHPTRRRQENLALLGGVASIPLLIFIGLPAAVMMGVASGFVGFASKASPPPKSSEKPKRLPRKIKGDEKFSGNFSGKEAIKLKKKSMSCSDPCKYSTHPKDTCDCACNGSQHGIWAWGPSGTTTPNKVRKRRAPAQKRTRRQVRK